MGSVTLPQQVGLSEEELALGEMVYAESCVICHLDGAASGLNPSLWDSTMLAEDLELSAQVILHGQQGISQDADGHILGGIMPGMAWLSDEEIAAVVNYSHQRFHPEAERRSLPVEEVAKIRQQAP